MALLRRYEPVVRYMRGEPFFPMDTAPYLRYCGLWMQRANTPAVCLIPQGKLTLDQLVQPRPAEFGTVYFLRITEPKDAEAGRRLPTPLARPAKNGFRAGRGRLARVGYLSRLVDALYSISLLARGRVPGQAAAAAERVYRRILAEQAHYCYHGRVVRQDGWTVLQYWFFYTYNSWRSGFFGANDHEADWEMIGLYLADTAAGDRQPEWVAYASHDFSGDDLRRRWDDPELEKVGEHPVIYAGAGSHASYYTAGEYLTELELPIFAPLNRAVRGAQHVWRNVLRQAGEDAASLAIRATSSASRSSTTSAATG